MEKKLLSFLVAAFMCFNLYGQTHCTTCHQGQRYPDSTHLSAWATHAMQAHPIIGNGNSSLGQSYVIQNVCGLNYTQSSILTETRSALYSFNANGTGFPTTMPIANIPPCNAVIQKAYLYWEASYTESAPPTVTATVTNPLLVVNTYPGTIIGQAGPKCWGETGSATWRADVTAAISGNGNYGVALNGFANAAYEVDGCTLIIIYTANGAYSGSISLWDGDIVEYYLLPSQTFSGINVCANSGVADAFGAFGDEQINVNGGLNTNTFNGSTATFPNIFWNFNDIPTNVTAGQTTTVFTPYTNNGGDCYAWSLAGLYWQNTTCVVCAGSSVTLTMSKTDPTCGNNNGTATVVANGGSSPYTYLWTPCGQTNATATGLSIGIYTVEVISGCDTSYGTDTLTGVSLLLAKNQGNIKCNGQSTGFAAIHASGGVPPYTYLWAPSGNTTDSIFNLSAGSYTVNVADNNGCNTNDTITITQPPVLTATTTTIGASCNGKNDGSAIGTGAGGTPPYIYSWSNAQTGDTAKNLSAGVYTVTVTDSNGCSVQATATVTQPPAMGLTLSGPQMICNGYPATLSASVSGGSQPYTYAWNTGGTKDSIVVRPVVKTTYTCVVTDANGCTESSTITVLMGAPIGVSITGNHSICDGGSVTICAITTGGTGGNQYTWQPGNITGPCIKVSPTSTTIYTVQVVDNCGSIATSTATVPVNPLPKPLFSADLLQGCSPLCIQFRDKTTLTQGKVSMWDWTFGNGDTADVRNPIYCYPDSGKYTVTLTVVSDSGCSSTLKILNLITVYSHPKAQFTLSPQPTDILNPNVQFTDHTTDNYGLSYWWWNFGDGADSVSTLENPTHSYGDTGSYCAQMIAMNIHGCTDTATNCLIIDPVFTLYIPDAFTPNGNARNDVFMAKGQYIKTFEMYIFDRWGMELFHSNDINNGWDGKVKGGSVVAQEDTYVYKILVTDTKKKQHTYIGAVSLIK